MARDISELGADVFDDTPKPVRKISPKKRNYIIGLSITGALLVGVAAATVVLCNTALSDYSNVENVMYYFTPKKLVQAGEEPTAVLYRLPSDKKFPSTFRIPTHVLGYKVVGVADLAFSTHKEIKKVIMPNTIEWIGERAFLDCTNLSSFTWSNNLVDIGIDAFSGTAFYEKLLKDDKGLYDIPSGILIYAGVNYFEDETAIVSDSLTEAEINSIKTNYPVTNIQRFSDLNVKNICSGAFKNNKRITYIDLPESLDDIYNSTFEGCSNLECIDGSHSALKTIGKRAFADCDSLKDINLPTALTAIGNEAFANTAITTIPELDKLESIGKGVFMNCTSLTSVNYTLNTVYENMFNGCSSLSTITWGTDNSNIDNVKSIEQGAFAGTGFTEFVFPKNVYTIYDFVFENCTSLEKVSLYGNFDDELLPSDESDDEVEGRRAEGGEESEYPCVDHNGNDCNELKGIQVIKEGAFKGCTSLSTINLYDFDEHGDMIFDGEDDAFTFPYSVIRCDSSSLQNSNHYTFAQTSPTKIVFSPNMKYIGAYVFNDVTSLTTVEFEQLSLSKLKTIKTAAFKGCENLVSIELPPQLTKIENSAFSGCKKLNDIHLDGLKITAINGETFYNCQSLTSLKLPSTVTSVKSKAFYKTYNLNYVVLPRAVTEVLNDAFTQCREASEEPMNVFISRSYTAAHVGGDKINFGKNWHDNTVVDSYFLEEGGTKLPGVSYWNADAESPVVIKLLSLEQSGTLAKTEYEEGDKFDSTGLTFKASYDDDTFIEFARTPQKDSEYITWNRLSAGDTSVTGTYTVGAVSLTITVSGITVTD